MFASRYRVDPRGDAGAAELKREDIEALPGLDQDVLRVTKYLPGTATNGVSSRPYVRGGRQNELGVYYDGIPLFEPFHFKDFQGLLGVLDPAVVGSLDFYSGVLAGAVRRPAVGCARHRAARGRRGRHLDLRTVAAVRLGSDQRTIRRSARSSGWAPRAPASWAWCSTISTHASAIRISPMRWRVSSSPSASAAN